MRSVLGELGSPLDVATVVFYDNVSPMYMSQYPVHHKRTKHIELDIHFVREKVSLGQVRVLHVQSSRQFIDVFTKGLPSTLFMESRNSLCASYTAAESARGEGVWNGTCLPLSAPHDAARRRASRHDNDTTTA
jgi:hypothetical protein